MGGRRKWRPFSVSSSSVGASGASEAHTAKLPVTSMVMCRRLRQAATQVLQMKGPGFISSHTTIRSFARLPAAPHAATAAARSDALSASSGLVASDSSRRRTCCTARRRSHSQKERSRGSWLSSPNLISTTCRSGADCSSCHQRRHTRGAASCLQCRADRHEWVGVSKDAHRRGHTRWQGAFMNRAWKEAWAPGGAATSKWVQQQTPIAPSAPHRAPRPYRPQRLTVLSGPGSPGSGTAPDAMEGAISFRLAR